MNYDYKEQLQKQVSDETIVFAPFFTRILTYVSIGEVLLESSTSSGPPPASRCLQVSIVIP